MKKFCQVDSKAVLHMAIEIRILNGQVSCDIKKKEGGGLPQGQRGCRRGALVPWGSESTRWGASRGLWEYGYRSSTTVTLRRAFQIQRTASYGNMRGRKMEALLMTELASEACVFPAWSPRQSRVGGEQHRRR